MTWRLLCLVHRHLQFLQYLEHQLHKIHHSLNPNEICTLCSSEEVKKYRDERSLPLLIEKKQRELNRLRANLAAAWLLRKPAVLEDK